MYITNDPDVSAIAQNAGVDRIFVDMEYIGKSKRQYGMDTVQSHHTIADVKRIKSGMTSAELLVRCNPIHEKTAVYPGSREEIDGIVAAGADVIMLPYFKTVQEVRSFVSYVGGRCRTMLLVETPEAAEAIDEILSVPGVDEVHIGLNDLSIGYKKSFMFELLADGTVERLCKKCAQYAIPYGFGGIASLGRGMLPSEYVIEEHYRLGSGCTILSRSFCDVKHMSDLDQIRSLFESGVQAIRSHEQWCRNHPENHGRNCLEVQRIVAQFSRQVKR